MNIIYIGFPKILLDNETTYFSYLVCYLESIDSQCIIQATKKLNGINIRVSPSSPKLNSTLIDEVKKFHNLFGIQLEFSKSMKTSVNINFNINF